MKAEPVRVEVAEAEGSLVEVIDHALDQGVVIAGELVLSLADVDLVYLRLSLLVCAADSLLPSAHPPKRDRGERS